MKTLSEVDMITERSKHLTDTTRKEKTHEYYVLTSVKGKQFVTSDLNYVAEAFILGKFKVDTGTGTWYSNGPSSNYISKPHWLKLAKIQRFAKYEVAVEELTLNF